MKEIMFLTETLSSGGAERVVSNLSLNLSDKINKKIILFDSKIDYPYSGELIVLDNSPYRNIFNKVYLTYSRFNQIKNLKKKNKEVPTISFLEYPNLINLLTRRYGNTIVSVRNHMSSKYKTGIKSIFWNLTIKYLYGKADKIIAVSEGIKEDLVENYNIPEGKIKVIYNSYPLDEIKKKSLESIEEKYDFIFKNPVIITVGRLHEQKGQWHLIRSFKRVREQIPDAKLVIMGSGNLKNELKSLCDKLSLSDDVYFLEFDTNPFKYIAKSKIFVLPSLYEGFPNALAEAMVCGIPVVAADCLTGPKEILAPDEFHQSSLSYNINLNRYGLLFPVCNGISHSNLESLSIEEELMAKLMLTLLENNNLWNYYSSKSIERINDLDISVIIKEWENIV